MKLYNCLYMQGSAVKRRQTPSLFYILDGHTPVPQPNSVAWAEWFEKADRRVAKTVLPGDVEVSTVFLGMNHNWADTGEPILFETMIFGGPYDKYIARCSTWEQAEEQHKAVINFAKSEVAA